MVRNCVRLAMGRTGRYLLVWVLWMVAATVAADEFRSGLLFRLQPSVGPESYLFGTMHSDEPRVIELAQPVVDLIKMSDKLVLELDMSPGELLASMTGMIISDGRTLDQIVGAELYAQTRKAVKGLGIPEVAVRDFKPWAIAVMLSMPPSKSGQFLDLILYQKAVENGIEVVGLESAKEQMGVFDQMSESDQIYLLRETLAQLDQIPSMLDDMLRAYLESDLAGLETQMDAMWGSMDSGIVERFEEAVIISRNHRMVERALPILQKYSVVIAVGAGHLPGEEGLLNQLRQRGFSIEKIF
ncbi:MAG: TraB/GumN family protein [Chromatiales bacterium]|nr:TraB/GumN family protein [Chromatiales bacterium]